MLLAQGLLRKSVFTRSMGRGIDGCWTGQFFPELCCQPPAGLPNCFSEELTYERCCDNFRKQECFYWDAPPLVQPRGGMHGRSTAVPSFSVGFVVRSWHHDITMLEALLHSIAIFWPFGRIRTHAIVVLDAEAAETASTCDRLVSKFRNWVHCLGEPLPAWLLNGPPPKHPKAARVHWSTFLADQYAPQADYVAVIDSDVVFHSFGADMLLFAPTNVDSGLLPRPVLFGRWSSSFMFSALAVDERYPSASFMDSLPMIIRRQDFARLRSHLVHRFETLSNRKPLSFDEAFGMANHEVNSFATHIGWFNDRVGEYLCFQQAMGTYLFLRQRSQYFFSIQSGCQRRLAANLTCPSLRAALHVPELKRAALYNPNIDYFAEATGIIATGLCAAVKAHQKFHSGRLRFDRLHVGPHHDFCTSSAYENLLTKADDIQPPRSIEQVAPRSTWPFTHGVHCGRRNLLTLIGDYESWLATHVRPLGLAFLRWAFRGNATGRYAYNVEEARDNSGAKFDRLEMLVDWSSVAG